MKIKYAAAVALFTSLGFKLAEKWSAERLNAKLAKLAPIINDPEQVDPDVIEDKEVRKLFDEIAKATKKGEKLIVEEEKAEKEEKPAKKSKKAEKSEDSEESEYESDEDKSEESEEDDEESEESDKDESSEESDEDEEDEKPAKKSKKADKPAKKSDKPAKESSAKKDKFGYREGTVCSKLAAALKSKPQTQGELSEAAELTGTNYDALKKLVNDKVAERVEKDGTYQFKLRK